MKLVALKRALDVTVGIHYHGYPVIDQGKLKMCVYDDQGHWALHEPGVFMPVTHRWDVKL